MKGVSCWFAEHALLPGDDISANISKGFKDYDKLLLVCSEASLGGSWWVGAEVEVALEKEQSLMKNRGSKVLAVIPLDLDGCIQSADVLDVN